MAIDPTTQVGKVRLRIGDISDLPLLPDSVYEGAISDASGNLPEAAKVCATYILAMLTFRTHKKLVQMEIWDDNVYTNYKDFLLSTISNPALMSYTAMPVLIGTDVETNPLKQFTEDWNNCWVGDNVTQMVHDVATWADTHYWDNV
jgi:hypothetical protein